VKKTILLIILIIVPLSMLVYNDSQYSPYNKDIDKINHARMYEQVIQNEKGMKEADDLKKTVLSQKNYENQLLIAIFLPLIVLLLGDALNDKNNNKQKAYLQKRKYELLKNKANICFEIIENSNELNKKQNIQCIKEIEYSFLNYYNSEDVSLTNVQTFLCESIISNFTSLIYTHEFEEINKLKENLHKFLLNDKSI
jgi:short subunit fatty acids transporter